MLKLFMSYYACCLDAIINTGYFTEQASKRDSCDNNAHSAQVEEDDHMGGRFIQIRCCKASCWCCFAESRPFTTTSVSDSVSLFRHI